MSVFAETILIRVRFGHRGCLTRVQVDGERVQVGLVVQQAEYLPELIVFLRRNLVQVFHQYFVRLANLLYCHVNDGLGEHNEIAVLVDAKVLVRLRYIANIMKVITLKKFKHHNS